MTVYDSVVQQIDSCILNSLARANCTPIDISRLLDSFLEDYRISLPTVCWRFNELLKSKIICCTLQEPIPYESFFELIVSNEDLPIFSISDRLVEQLVDENNFPVLNSPANQINYVCIEDDLFILHLHDEAMLNLDSYMKVSIDSEEELDDTCPQSDFEKDDPQPQVDFSSIAENDIQESEIENELSDDNSNLTQCEALVEGESSTPAEEVEACDDSQNEVVESNEIVDEIEMQEDNSEELELNTDSIEIEDTQDEMVEESSEQATISEAIVEDCADDSPAINSADKPVESVETNSFVQETTYQSTIEVINTKSVKREEQAFERKEMAVGDKREDSHQYAAAEPYSRPIRAQDVAAMADNADASIDEKKLSALRALGLIEPEAVELPVVEPKPEPEHDIEEQKAEPVAKPNYLFSPVRAPQTDLEKYLQKEENDQQFSYKSVLVNVFKDSIPQQVTEENNIEISDKPITNFGEFREEMRKKGFTVKQYVAESTYQYYSQRYINVNKIKFATSLITYAIALAMIVVAFFAGETYANLGFKTYIAVAAGLLVVPGFYCLKYVTYKDKHAPANFSLKLSLVTSFIAALLIMMIFLLLAFFLPSTNANISDIKTLVAPVFYPLAILLLMPISVLVYAGLYRSKRFHL